VKAVATLTEEDLDPYICPSLSGDGVATTLSGLFGGSGTTTYAENIGVMGYTRVDSTLAYLIAGGVAIALGTIAAIVIYQVLRFFEPEVPPHTGIGDSLVEPLAQAPDRRRPGTA
jgi:xanthine/uracil permease